MKKITTSCLALSLLLPIAAHAQTASDDIKVGTVLSQAGIRMKGIGTRLLPLPPGEWEVVARVDEKMELTNRANEYVPPAPKVVLTLANKDARANLVAAVVSYSPEVVRIRWTNGACEAPKANVVDTLGTTNGSLDYACVVAYYNKSGLKRAVVNAAASSSDWIKKYLSALAPKADAFPDAHIWITLLANRDQGRLYGVTLMARSNPSLVNGDEFDAAIRAWLKATGKSVVAALNGDADAIGMFPTAP